MKALACMCQINLKSHPHCAFLQLGEAAEMFFVAERLEWLPSHDIKKITRQGGKPRGRSPSATLGSSATSPQIGLPDAFQLQISRDRTLKKGIRRGSVV
jgi:hypothetical protein